MKIEGHLDIELRNGSAFWFKKYLMGLLVFKSHNLNNSCSNGTSYKVIDATPSRLENSIMDLAKEA